MTSGELRLKGLKLPPHEPPKVSLTVKIFLMAALLILIAVGGAVAVSAYRSRAVADAKIAEDLKKSGPAWESFQQNRYAELQRSLAVVVNNAGTISLMSTLVPETGKPDAATVFDTLKREQASSARADFLIATDPKGVGLARTDRPLPYAVDLSGVPTISGAIQGEQTEGIWLSGGRLYDVVAAPVLEGGSRLVGVIAAAFQINDEVALNLEQLLNTQVVFLADAGKPGEPAKAALAASTMGPLGAAALAAIERRDDLVQAVLRQGKTIGPLCARRGRRNVPGLRPAHSLLLRPAGRRRGRPPQPREGAGRLPPDPEHANPRRTWPPSSSPSFCPSFSRAASPGPSSAWSPPPSRSASATSTPRSFPSSRRTRSGSSLAPSGRCSRSSRKRRPSNNTSPP